MDKVIGVDLAEIGRIKTRLLEIEESAREQQAAIDPQAKELLAEALELLEYATYHDGRYGQETSSKFQTPAQKLVPRIAKRLGRKPYQDFK